MRQYIEGLAIFTGTAIGVGIFGLPFAAAKFGFFPTLLWFVVLGGITTIMQLIYGEITLRGTEKQRMPGYAKTYLGNNAKAIVLVSNAIGMYAALLAYIIIGGKFLANLLIPTLGGTEIIYLLIYFAAGSFIIFAGNKLIASSEIFSLIIFTGVMGFLFYKGFPLINFDNFLTISPEYFILPYGIILFSISGITVVPEIRETLGQSGKNLKSILTIGSLITIITSILFVILILGITGAQTTDDALLGLVGPLGEKILITGFIFGIITTFTSYITVGLTLKKIFWYDLKFSHFNSWAIACFTPIILYFAGVQNFIQIIAFSAAITSLIDGTILYLIYLKAKKIGKRIPEYELPFGKKTLYPLVIIFILGVIATVLTL